MNKLVLHPRFHGEDWCMRGSILQAPLISQGYQRTNTSCHQRCAFSCDMNFWTTFRCFSFLLTRSRFALTWKKNFSPKNDQTGDVLLCMVIAHTFVLWVLSPGTNFIPSHFKRPRWFQRDKGGDRKKKTFSYYEKTLDALTTFYNYQKAIFSISVVHQTVFKEILHFLRCVVLKINGS